MLSVETWPLSDDEDSGDSSIENRDPGATANAATTEGKVEAKGKIFIGRAAGGAAMITHSGPVPVLGANKSHVSKPSAVNPVQDDDEVEEITILDDDDEEPTPNPAGLATNSSSSLLTFFVKDH